MAQLDNVISKSVVVPQSVNILRFVMRLASATERSWINAVIMGMFTYSEFLCLLVFNREKALRIQKSIGMDCHNETHRRITVMEFLGIINRDEGDTSSLNNQAVTPTFHRVRNNEGVNRQNSQRTSGGRGALERETPHAGAALVIGEDATELSA
jgi:hypothetical protein